tara:strand:+ start:1420 stop:2661 length:1242 start_codon:yes stop_codon:yes gene_type:complete
MLDMQITNQSVDGLIPYINNAKVHSDEQVSMIAASIKEFGFNNPILVDGDSGVIAGHGRLLAAKKLGFDEVPTIELGHLSDTQKKAYILADNRLGEVHTEWDMNLVNQELSFLDELEFDVDLTGFEMPEVIEEGLTDEDEVPELVDDPKTKLGDVWLLGNHRLMCGDSTSIDAVDKLMDGQKADMVFTDPPYGMSYGGGRAKGDHVKFKRGGGIKAHGMIKGDDLEGDDLLRMVSDSIGSSSASAKEGAAFYVCFTWRTYSEFDAALENIGLEPKACIVWDKKSIGLGLSNYRPQHEFIFYCGGQWYGDKGQSDVWYMSRGATGAYVHPTQKPVELIEKAIINSSKSGDVLHDCFGGSGSTLIACEKTNRNCRMMELDEKYCDVIINRWQNFTGKQALLEGTGLIYDEVETNR